MRFLALACDYDGTLARHGRVEESTLEALARLRGTGRKIVLASGRVLEDLRQVMPGLEVFDVCVLENGAVLHDPGTGEEAPLAQPPPRELIDRLRELGVDVGLGRVIVATSTVHEATAMRVVGELGLALQASFNKGSMMILPAGVDKGSGLLAALGRLALCPRNVVAVGDGENDHALLSAAGYAVAVANAVPMLQDRADMVTGATHGQGVEQLIQGLIEDDLESWAARPGRRDPAPG